MFDIKDIQKILPHRYPFLLVDKILKLEPSEKIVGLKNVSINENFFQGHYPNEPVMPGVLIIESMAQTGGFLMLKSFINKEDVIPYFAGIDKAKFRRPVMPGDQLIITCEVIKLKSKVAKVKAIAEVNDELAAEAKLLFAAK
ncbi:MAG: 3-hydroxyacyl-ACP dehydratase FabZ [Halanaerobiales bacterium]|nr:3-hydroxyacyl-ACP dehydratase FabZ [Halanaerobiales bacterium]